MKSTIYIVLGIFLFSGYTQAQQIWTLQQCVDTALVKNRNVKQQALTLQNKEIAYKQARQNLLPNLNASAEQNFSFGRSISANNTYQKNTIRQTSISLASNLTLFDGLKMKYDIEARKADKYASEADLEKIKQDIILNVSGTFLQVLLNKELLQVAKNQYALTESKIEQRKKLVENGKMAEGEMLELYAQQAKEELNKTQAENNLKLSLLDLAQIMELDNFENLDIIVPENLLNMDLSLLTAESVYESAVSHRPEIKAAEYRMQSNEKNIQIAKSYFYPSLNFYAQSGTSYYGINGMANNSYKQQFDDNLGFQIGLSLKIPIFNKFDTKNKVQTAKINVESSKLDIDNAKLELKKTIQQAYYNAIAAKSRWEAANKSELASQEAYRFTNQKYEAGRASIYDLYQAKSNLTQVLSEQVQAKYEYVFRMKILELMK